MKKLLLLILLLSKLSLADCGITIVASSIPISYNQNFNFQAVTISVTKAKNPACDIGVTFTAGGGATYGARRMLNGSATLGYQLYQDSALTHVLKDFPDLTSTNDFFLVSFPVGKKLSQTLTYYIKIPPNTLSLNPAGSYLDNFTIKAYEGSNFSSYSTVDHVAAVNVSATIPKMVTLSMVGAGQAFDPNSTSQSLSFGTLTNGAVLGFDLLVQSNAGFAITFSSQHNGVLQNSSPQINTVVGYGVQVDGSARSLNSSATTPITVATGSGQTSINGNRHNVAVTIGSVDATMAGTYSDNITVTATTTE